MEPNSGDMGGIDAGGASSGGEDALFVSTTAPETGSFSEDAVADTAASSLMKEWGFKPDDGTPEPGTPEARLAEMEGRLSQYAPFDSVIETLRQGGITDAESLEAGLAQQEQMAWESAREQERSVVMDAEMGNLAAELQARIDHGEMSPEEASAVFQQQAPLVEELLTHRMLMEQMGAQALEQELASAVSGDENLRRGGEGLLRVLASVGLERPVPDLARYLSSVIAEERQHAVAEYEARRSGRGGGSAPPPMGSDGGAMAPAPHGSVRDEGASWASIFGIRPGR